MRLTTNVVAKITGRLVVEKEETPRGKLNGGYVYLQCYFLLYMPLPLYDFFHAFTFE
jgi:hypothetical protein